MNIAIPLGGQIRMVICSSFVIAKRKDTTHYDLSGESFQLTGVTADQVYVFDDSVVITEGMELTHNLIAQSLPLDRFVSVSAEEALPNAIGLLLRLAVADGRVTDSELLRIQPALEGRLWQPGLDVKVGDVYTSARSSGAACRTTPRRVPGRLILYLLSGARWRFSPKMPCASGLRALTTSLAMRSLIRMRTARGTPVSRLTLHRPAGNRPLSPLCGRRRSPVQPKNQPMKTRSKKYKAAVIAVFAISTLRRI